MVDDTDTESEEKYVGYLSKREARPIVETIAIFRLSDLEGVC